MLQEKRSPAPQTLQQTCHITPSPKEAEIQFILSEIKHYLSADVEGEFVTVKPLLDPFLWYGMLCRFWAAFYMRYCASYFRFLTFKHEDVLIPWDAHDNHVAAMLVGKSKGSQSETITWILSRGGSKGKLRNGNDENENTCNKLILLELKRCETPLCRSRALFYPYSCWRLQVLLSASKQNCFPKLQTLPWQLSFTKPFREYLLLHFVLTLTVRRGDVLAAWSGIRPLVIDPNSKNTESHRPQSPDTRQQEWPGNDSRRQMDHLPLHGSGHHGRRYQSLRAQAGAGVPDRWIVPRGRGGIYS